MLALHLVRHAEYPQVGEILGGRSEHALNERGQAQAARLGEALAGVPLAAVYTSPRRRAQETAAAIAARHGLKVQADPDLDELDFGDWTGRRVDGLADDPLWRRFNAARGLTRIPGGETMAEALGRMLRFLERALCAHEDQAVAAVGHADPLRALLCFLLAVPLDAFQRVEIAPAGRAVLLVDGWGAKLTGLHAAP